MFILAILQKKLDLKEIQKALSPVCPKATVYLWEKHIKAGFSEYLVRNNYGLLGRDTWLVFNSKLFKEKAKIPVKHIKASEFEDFRVILAECFKDWPSNDRYLEICHQCLTGKRKSSLVDDFVADFFVIYENKKPVAGAGLFSSKKESVGYFHDDGTLEKHRNKGYHTALIKARIDYCLEREIKTLYAIVDHGEQSWRNYINCGFGQWQIANLFVLKR